MTPYITILLLSFLLVALDAVQLNRKEKLYFFVPFVALLIVFAGSRPPGIDRDYQWYNTAYGYMKYLGWSHLLQAYALYQFEIGYVFLTKLFYSLGLPFAGFLFLYEAAMGVVLGRLIYRYSPYPFTSLCMYVCLFYFLRDFTQIRFAFSAVLLVNGLLKFAEDKRRAGWACLIVAGLLHNSAWIGLFIPLFYTVFYNRWIYLLFPPLGYLISLFHPIQIILSLVGLPQQITRYLTEHVTIGASIMSYVFCYVLMILSVFHYEKLKALYGRKFEYLYISFALSTFIGLMFVEFPIMQRISGALFTTSILFVPYIIKTFTEKKWYGYREIFAFGIVLVYFYYGIKLILVGHLLKPFF